MLEGKMTAGCHICHFVADEIKQAKNLYDTILYESKHFVSVPTKSPIIEGWLLIIPKKHYLSLADLPLTLLKDLEDFTAFVRSQVEKHYGSCIIVEQGPLKSGESTGCGVDHAHLHLIPLENNDIRCKINQSLGTCEENWLEDISLTSLHHIRTEQNQSYFYLVDKKRKSILFRKTFPRQLLRKVITLNSPHENRYDWREFDFDENLQNTILTFRSEKNSKHYCSSLSDCQS